MQNNIVIDIGENLSSLITQKEEKEEAEDMTKVYGSEPSDSDMQSETDMQIDSDMQSESDMQSDDGKAGASASGAGAGAGAGASASGAGASVHYNKLSYKDVRNQITKAYEQDIVHRYSSALDILASYIKGQKTIYMETRSYLVNILNGLMFTALFVSGFITVVQNSFCDNAYVLAGLSACVTFILAVINYSKLDASAEAHRISSYQYDKLQSFIEFQSGQVLLFSNPILNKDNMERHCEKLRKNIEVSYSLGTSMVTGMGNSMERNSMERNSMEAGFNENIKVNLSSDNIERDIFIANAENEMRHAIYQERLQAENELINNMRDNMVRIEADIADIKETNQFIIPQKIRYTYPLLYNTNVFSVIKKIDDYRAKMVTDLKNVKNELRFINAYNLKNVTDRKYKKRANDLFQQKKNIINIFLFLNTAFSMIDKMFQQEILNAKLQSDYWLRFFIYNLFRCGCSEQLLKKILPVKYIEPEVSAGDIFGKIMSFGNDVPAGDIIKKYKKK